MNQKKDPIGERFAQSNRESPRQRQQSIQICNQNANQIDITRVEYEQNISQKNAHKWQKIRRGIAQNKLQENKGGN